MRGYTTWRRLGLQFTCIPLLLRLLLVCFIASSHTHGVLAQRPVTRPCPPIPKFNDVASRTLRSTVVFTGYFISSNVSKQSGAGSGSTSSVGVKKQPSQSVFTALFKVDKLLRGQWTIPTTRGGSQHLEVLVGTRIETPSSGSSSVLDCAGLLGLKFDNKYLVFLDGVDSEVDRSGVAMHHPEGRPMKLTKRGDEKIVEKLSCPTCKGRC